MQARRIQRKRTKGWRMPAGTVYVGRGTRWGNHFNDTQIGVVFSHWSYPMPIIQLGTEPSRERCIDMYVAWLAGRLQDDPDFIEPLRGHDLACWCDLAARCHADVLLTLANRESPFVQLPVPR